MIADSPAQDTTDPELHSESVRAETVADRFIQGTSIGELARALGLSADQVEEAVRLAVVARADGWTRRARTPDPPAESAARRARMGRRSVAGERPTREPLLVRQKEMPADASGHQVSQSVEHDRRRS